MDPISRMAQYASHPEDFEALVLLLSRWRSRKLSELQFISIAVSTSHSLPPSSLRGTSRFPYSCSAQFGRTAPYSTAADSPPIQSAVLAAAVIGSFSWTVMADIYWLATSLWYCCLFLSVLGIFLSAQQIAILHLLGDLPEPVDPLCHWPVVDRYLPLLLSQDRPRGPAGAGGQWSPKSKMVFTWQCPTMFMSYSVCLFLVGLTLVVCTPLIRRETRGPNFNIAIVYLVVAALSSTVFMFSSFWTYHFIDLEQLDSSVDKGRAKSGSMMESQIYCGTGDVTGR